MKKIFICLLLLFLTSGCSAEYNLTIDDLETFTYEETGYIMAEDIEEIYSIYDSDWPTPAYQSSNYDSESPTKFEDVEYYDVQSYQEGNLYKVKYHYKFPSNRFDESSGIYNAFSDFKINYNEEENTTTLDTGNFYYDRFPNLEELVINITINNSVLAHNANQVEGNTYTWILTPENFDTARILLSYSNIGNETEEETNWHFLIGTIVFLCFMIFLVAFSFIRKKRGERKK